jgi:hypothetical protein
MDEAIGGSTAGTSFSECTAQSMEPSSRGLLDLLGEQALAADLQQAAILDAVACWW